MSNYKNIKVVVDDTPRVYLSFENHEVGCDKQNCYERISQPSGYIAYVNVIGMKTTISKGEPFFDILENMFLASSKEQLNKISHSESILLKEAKHALNIAQAELRAMYKRIGINGSNVLDTIDNTFNKL